MNIRPLLHSYLHIPFSFRRHCSKPARAQHSEWHREAPLIRHHPGERLRGQLVQALHQW